MNSLDVSVGIVAYIALFASIGFAFVFVNLLLGKFLRPADPHEEKQEIYECGEPPIGSSFVQFDLRFYVVALVFIIFDVEVAFLFPWATVFGKATNLVRHQGEAVVSVEGEPALSPTVESLYREMGVRNPTIPSSEGGGSAAAIKEGAANLSKLAAIAALAFFVVLLIGFAYEWRTGALDWVRAITSESAAAVQKKYNPTRGPPAQSVLSA